MVELKTHNNKPLGALSHAGFCTYKATLHSTWSFFTHGDVKGWARDYRIAQMVFADNIPGRAARESAKGVGYCIFHSLVPETLGGIVPKEYRSKIYQVHDGESFMHAIQWGQNPYAPGLPLLFDYVLLKSGEFRFAPVDVSNTVVQTAGKHVVISEGAEEVLCAGDMFVVSGTLYITNASGTYRPGFHPNLAKLGALLRQELPGLQLHLLDAADPAFKPFIRQYIHNYE